MHTCIMHVVPSYILLQCKGGKYKVKATSGRGQARWAEEDDLTLVTSAADADRERADRERTDRERTDRERTYR